MLSRFALAAIVSLFLAHALAAAQQFPYVGYVNRDDVALRSGPGKNYYATAMLYQGDTVEVYRHDPGGWYAVRPPKGSFSWVLASNVRLVDGQLGVVEGQEVVARVGTDHGDTRDVIQVRLDEGEEVVVLEAQQFGEGSDAVTWFKIAPPAGEFRWIAADAIDRERLVDDAVEESSDVETLSVDEPQEADEPTSPPRRLKPIAAEELVEEVEDLADEEMSDEVPDEVDEEVEQPRSAKKPQKRRSAKQRSAPPAEADESDNSREDVSYDEEYTEEEEESSPRHEERARRRPPRDEEPTYEEEPDDQEEYEDESYDDQVEQAQYQTPIEKSRARRAEAAAKSRAARVASRSKIDDKYDPEATLRSRERHLGEAPSSDISGDHESTDLPPNAAIEEIDLALSTMVTDEPHRWDLQPLKMRTEEILAEAPTAVERGRARLLLSRIERFEDVQRRSKALASAQANIERRRGQVDRVREARRAGPVSAEINASRYDGVGRLAQIDSNKPGGASYALVDSAGRVRSYVTPAPGVNLRHYLGQSVGITGTQGYLPDADRHHVTARRVTVIDGRTLR